MSTVTQDCRTALKTKLDAQFSVVRKYDAWDLSSGTMVTIGSPSWEMRETPDQKYGVRAVTFPVYVYQQVDGSAEKSFEYQDANFHKALTALGADRTLGGKVVGSEIVGDPRMDVYSTDSGARISVIELAVRVMPFANVA